MKNKTYKIFNGIITGIVLAVFTVFAIGFYSFLRWIIFKF